MNTGNTSSGAPSMSRGLEFAMFLTAMAWVGAANSIASRAAAGISGRFALNGVEGLLQALFLVFLAVLGFSALDFVATRGTQKLNVLPLPRRATSRAEWGTGAAIGWGLCLAVVLPVLLSGHLHGRFNFASISMPFVLLSVATLLTAALAEEAIFRGYPFQRLTRAIGPSWAAVLLSFGFAVFLVSGHAPRHLFLALADGLLFGLLLSMAYLRTHGLWMGWGLHFAYRAVMSVILGLPIAGRGTFGAIADTYTSGPRWLTGGAFGLDAALLTAFWMLLAGFLLYRLTREWSWRYTHAPIVAAGYEVTIAPPAAHTAMEKAAAPPPLVQILPTTPAGPFAANDELTHK